jgi:hypothetical protein
MRTFETGATRNDDANKLDYEGFEHPEVKRCFAEYMHEHRVQADGTLRASDNWQKGIDKSTYMKSLCRHVEDLHALHRGCKRLAPEDGHVLTVQELCCAIRFNVNGYLFEDLGLRKGKIKDGEER